MAGGFGVAQQKYFLLCVYVQVQTWASKHSLFTHSCVKQQCVCACVCLRPEATEQRYKTWYSVSVCHHRQI